MYTGALVGRAPIGEPSAAADSARRVNIKDRERTILVFEVGANKQSAIRHMSRRELLEEARRASTPLRLQRADGPAARLGADAVLKARDVRKVDPLFAGRLEPAGKQRVDLPHVARLEDGVGAEASRGPVGSLQPEGRRGAARLLEQLAARHVPDRRLLVCAHLKHKDRPLSILDVDPPRRVGRRAGLADGGAPDKRARVHASLLAVAHAPSMGLRIREGAR